MASGVKVDDEVKTIFQEMKKLSQGDNQDDRLRFLVFHIDDDLIKLKVRHTNKDLEGQNTFEFFTGILKESCCYLLYDCHYENKDGPKDELVFVMWSPDASATTKSKMKYSSSKDYLVKIFDGVKHKFELHDYDDCSPGEFARKLCKTAKSIEGIDCTCQQMSQNASGHGHGH